MNREASFGDTWTAQPLSFWDEMWRLHKDSPMTRCLVDEVVENDPKRIVEIGCGAGHILERIIRRKPPRWYTGVEISSRAIDALVERTDPLGFLNRDFFIGDFVEIVAGMTTYPATNFNNHDLVFSRGVLQHQVHWAPMVVAALRIAPRVAMGIGYTHDGDRHRGGWTPSGHYDVTISLPLMRTEAAAMGLHLESLEKMPNTMRQNVQEALAIFTR